MQNHISLKGFLKVFERRRFKVLGAPAVVSNLTSFCEIADLMGWVRVGGGVEIADLVKLPYPHPRPQNCHITIFRPGSQEGPNRTDTA